MVFIILFAASSVIADTKVPYTAGASWLGVLTNMGFDIKEKDMAAK
jgi:hypothetical protein